MLHISGTTTRLSALALALGLGLAFGAARAEDRYPAAWRLGYNSAFALWGFPDWNRSGPRPDNDLNLPHRLTISGSTSTWLLVEGRTCWRLDAAGGGALEIRMLRTATDARDRIRVQVTTRAGEAVVGVTGDDGPAYTQYGSASPYVEAPDWTTTLTEWTRSTCPAVEVIRITPAPGDFVVIDEVIIDSNNEYERHPEYAANGSIDIAFDPLGASCSGALPIFTPTPLYVLATLRGATAPGIVGAEFAIVDFYPSPNVFVITTPNPLASISVGDPLAGCNIAFMSCQGGPTVLLYTLAVFPLEMLANDRLIQVVAHWTPSYPNFTCPKMILCDPIFSSICVAGGAAILNPTGAPCTVAVQPTTWTQMKSLFR